MKIVTTKRLISETRKQLDQQNQMGGDKLRPIDFQKLEIETEHVIKETEANHQTLKSLKKICGTFLKTKTHAAPICSLIALLSPSQRTTT